VSTRGWSSASSAAVALLLLYGRLCHARNIHRSSRRLILLLDISSYRLLCRRL
jgi:hypothetical protein